MKEFTPRTSLFKVRHCKEFAAFKKYVLAPRQFAFVMQAYKIKNLKWFYPLNARDTAQTLNEMRKKVQNRSLFYAPFARKDTGVYCFLIGKNAPFVLITPGGGYGDVCSLIEGYSVALRLNELGYNAFIVNYTVGKMTSPTYPAEDMVNAFGYIMSNASSWNVAKEYAVCGFSAGGHLAACWCTKKVGYERYNLPKPQAAFLAYPVITMGEYTHEGSMKNLLGKNKDDTELRALYSVEKQVTGDYPPVFIWQCRQDKVVPFENSLMMADALKANGVPYEFMPVDGTVHGWGLGKGTAVDGWLDKAVDFWRENRA